MQTARRERAVRSTKRRKAPARGAAATRERTSSAPDRVADAGLPRTNAQLSAPPAMAPREASTSGANYIQCRLSKADVEELRRLTGEEADATVARIVRAALAQLRVLHRISAPVKFPPAPIGDTSPVS